MKNLIIQKALEIVKADFMQYQDFDEAQGLTLKEALTVLIGEHLEDVESSEIYDFINKLF